MLEKNISAKIQTFHSSHLNVLKIARSPSISSIGLRIFPLFSSFAICLSILAIFFSCLSLFTWGADFLFFRTPDLKKIFRKDQDWIRRKRPAAFSFLSLETARRPTCSVFLRKCWTVKTVSMSACNTTKLIPPVCYNACGWEPWSLWAKTSSLRTRRVKKQRKMLAKKKWSLLGQRGCSVKL